MDPDQTQIQANMNHPFHGSLQYVGPPIEVPLLRAEDVELVIRQQPTLGKVVKDGMLATPLEPTPVIQIKVNSKIDACENFLTSPNLFIFVQLIGVQDTETPRSPAESLLGNYASSLHRLNDENGNDGGFFIFGDLAVKVEGVFILRFKLYERRDSEIAYISMIDSAPFNAVPGKEYSDYANTLEISALNRAFWNQGVRLRVRTVPTKRKPKASSVKEEHFHPYKQPRSLKQRTQSPDASTRSQKKISEKAVPVEVPAHHPKPASDSASVLDQPRGRLGLREPGSAAHQLMNWPDPLAPGQLSDILEWPRLRPRGMPVQTYPPFQDPLGATSVAQQSILNQISVPPDALAQSNHFRRVSTDQIQYQQTPRYLTGLMSQEFMPNLQSGSMPLPVIKSESIQPAPLQPTNVGSLPPELSIEDEVQPVVADALPTQERRPRLGELRMYPSGDQNLSAGSMEPAISLSPPNDVTDVGGTSGGAF